MYDSYDLFAATDEHLTRPKFSAERERRFYPSEASVVTFDQFNDKVVHGGCLRASYFRVAEDFKGVPFNARSEYIFIQGKDAEESLIKLWKEMGVWHANNVKFVDKKHNISGELDAILVEPGGQLYGVEIKTFYGYMAEKEIFGNKSAKGFPKMSHLLQTLLYLNFFKDRLPYFRIAYFGRDSVKRRTFLIQLHQEGEIIYPVVEGEVIRSFSVNGIYERYQQLQDCIDKKIVPPNDYELRYSDEKIHNFFKKGKVAKTKYEKWTKGKLGKNEKIGDWNCSYCKYVNQCWPNG